jgi:hypothetical protein
MLVIDDLFVSGSSFASGWGEGFENYKSVTGGKSWVNYFAEQTHARKMWNYSIVGKPIGMATSDTVSFCKNYLKKHGSLKNLFVIVEYSTPRYKHWGALPSSALISPADIEIIPVAYLSRQPGKLLDTYFLTRESDPVTLEVKYNVVDRDKVTTDHLAQFEADATEWYMDSRTAVKYISYAYDEIKYLKDFLDFYGCNYLMFWCTGKVESHRKLVDRYMKKLMADRRLIPASEFNAITATLEWSLKPFREHPDDVGHRRIAEYLVNYTETHSLSRGSQHG